MTGGVSSMATPVTVVQHSAWHSPMPYLFGGLAAMLGLIAFALLILACSYWKLSTRLINNSADSTDLEVGDLKTLEIKSREKEEKLEEKVVVIMAGDVIPTFLATPVSAAIPSSSSSSSSSLIENAKNIAVSKIEEENLKENAEMNSGNIQQGR